STLFCFQAEDGIRDRNVTGVQTCALPICTKTLERQNNQRDGLLDQLGNNISDQARSGNIDPVIGRDKEVKRVIETLNRRNKNNRSEERSVGKERRSRR